ncbi:CYTH domain-containing protein [archaeon]|mgnify:FL=1|jgi:adenylate cyclase, class 2|nr:CYTH domain-containing protein [archaeon]MBT6182878.1 CYTH domain-containing protein [archaeon]MBT6606255.1 CYTH domain-containing protein [archaeon]MBT7251576.1 CYTH domain-containing protein [archaeon]MBT7660879.1 CYTH domain-containing protein [archaeon]
MVWLEVETKVPLKNSEVAPLRKKIKTIANFEKRGKKSDDYFAIQKSGYPKKAFRFRTMKDSTEVTFKRWLRSYWTDLIVVKQEFEFKLCDAGGKDDLLELFGDFGFYEWVKKIKRNETYKHKKNKKISIEINHVKHLGYFMEIEYLCKKKDMKKAVKAITKTLDELSIEKKQIDNTGYTKLLWKKGTLGKSKFID